MKKRLLAFLLVLVMVITLVPVSAFAANSYYINGKSVQYTDFSSAPQECWAYAQNFYNKIWGTSFSSYRGTTDDSLRNLSTSELTLTADHLKKYVTNAALGSCLRICTSEYLSSSDGWGHSQIIVQKDSNGFTVFEGGLSASPYCREKYYTWSDYISTSWLGGTYTYIKYIKWPGASPYTSSVTVTFNANGGSCSTSTKTITSGGSIGTLPAATRTNYTFDGWYTASSGGSKISTSTTFSSNTTVYAHWTVNTANVKLYGADGSVWKTTSANVGSTYTLPTTYPTATDSYFCGWSYTNGADTYDLRPGDKITINGAVSLYPVFVSHDKATSGEEVYIYNIEDFTDEGYDVQEVTHTKETKIDKSYWSDWSSYSTTAVSASSTVQVRTKALYRYYYFKCPYCGAHEPFYGTSDCGQQIPSSAWNETWSTIPYSQCNYKTFSYTTSKYYTTSLGDGEIWCFSSGNLNDTAIGTEDAAGSSSVIKQGYSYRTYVEKYETQTETVTAYKITPSGCQHKYSSTHYDATCTEYEHTVYTCTLCGDSYVEYPADLYGEWSTTKPTGVDESLIETKTQYRYSNYETKTSYNTSESGWTQKSSTWEKSGSGTVNYVKSWPSGFSTSHSLYSTYNKTPKSASETTTAKTEINSDTTTGYIYYHWCRGEYTEGPINRATSKVYTSEFDTFHAFYNTKAPSSLTASPDGDGSYTFANSSCCTDSHWYYPINVYTQTYTTYKKLFTYERWTDWSSWSDTAVSATSTKKVETRTLYRYITEELSEHVWDEGTVTKAADCTTAGVKTFTCTLCGETKTETIPATGHNYVNGKCTCGAVDPDYQENPVRINIGSATVSKGTEVTLPVYINDNVGFAGFTFEINYDKTVMTLTNIAKGEVLNTSDSGMFTKNVEGNTVNYTDTVNICSDGVLLYLTFEIGEDATAGDYGVSLTLKDNKDTNFVNENSKAVRTEFQTGIVKVESTTPVEYKGRIVVSSEKARAGEEVTVSVSMEENPGIMVMVLEIDYDRSKLSLVGYEDGGLTGWTVSNNAVWLGDSDSTYNGEILKLKFKVLEDCEDGDVQINMLYSVGDIANYNEEVICPGVAPGKITVYSNVPGDFTGDGVVNALDLLRLKKYLAGDSVELAGTGDVTGDGIVNALDLLRLKKYLAGDSVVLESA